MSAFYIFICVIYVIICISLISAILLQQKRSSGLGEVMSGNGSDQTYWSKNKGRSLEGILERYSKILGIIFIILSFLLCLIK